MPRARRGPPASSDAEGVDRTVAPETLAALPGIAAVAFWGEEATATGALRRALAERDGPDPAPDHGGPISRPHCVTERHLCVDTTASGRGNASLLARAG